jgi:hypothetical protein
MFCVLNLSASDTGNQLALSETPMGKEELANSLEHRRRDTTMLAKKVVSVLQASLAKAAQFKQSMATETGMCNAINLAYRLIFSSS